jgi:ribonuclease BN (tRNA processing enzyme)
MAGARGIQPVRVTLVPSSVAERGRRLRQFLSSYLINDTVAIDAGSLGLYRTARHQRRIRHLFLTHTHLDHLASLATFIDNTYTGDGNCVTLYGSDTVLDCLQRDIFNDRLWPDLVRISQDRPPYFRLQQLEPERPVTVAGLRVTPIPVQHSVPTFGFLVEEGTKAVLFSSDTGPTEACWLYANRAADLRAVFLEATFPEALAWLAEVAGHLTPSLFAQEVRKVHKPVPFIAVHIHPRHRTQVVRELKALGLANLKIGRMGVSYSF